MAQLFIVEGKDAFVLAQICIERKMNPPKGYGHKSKFKDFVLKAEGISKIELAIQEALRKPEITNLGIVVDANSNGPKARFERLKQIFEKELPEFPFSKELSSEGFYQKHKNLQLGIWIMPDNIREGYLEHFISSLIPEKNAIWDFAKTTINELTQKPFCDFSESKEQKACIHTYLAWQKSPGLPMGTAIKANYFDSNSPNADKFISWFQRTFELEG